MDHHKVSICDHHSASTLTQLPLEYPLFLLHIPFCSISRQDANITCVVNLCGGFVGGCDNFMESIILENPNVTFVNTDFSRMVFEWNMEHRSFFGDRDNVYFYHVDILDLKELPGDKSGTLVFCKGINPQSFASACTMHHTPWHLISHIFPFLLTLRWTPAHA